MLDDSVIHDFVERPRPAAWYTRHYTELRDAIVATMQHGVRYDSIMAGEKFIELTDRKMAIKNELLVVTGGVKLWSETSHLTEEINSLLATQRQLKEQYSAIPKEDKAARKSFIPQVKAAQAACKDCREAGRDKYIEIGTGLSDDKICEYLYTFLGIPTYKKRRKESQKATPTADDITLKKIRLRFPRHAKLTELIMEHRKCNKLLGYLDESMIDKDGRIRCMYKVHGTQSGRLSSSKNPYGTGTNLQNFDRSLKTLLIPDKG